MTPRVLVVGDAVLDRDWAGAPAGRCPDSCGPVVRLDGERTRAGGAALTAVAAARAGAAVSLVTALGSDRAGDCLRRALDVAGVDLIDLGSSGPTPEKIRLRHGGDTLARLDRGCGDARPGAWTAAATDAVKAAEAVLLSDYGRGMVHHDGLGRALGRGAGRPIVWDPHRSSHLPVIPVSLATPSELEGRLLAGAVRQPRETAAALGAAWGCAVALTRGPAGVTLAVHGTVIDVPCDPIDGDPCGAGDWFAAGATCALATGAGELAAVSAGCAAARRWIGGNAAQRSGSRLVATSGCFDVLHAGHVALLRHARSVGDRLVVLLNSDDSVRRLKGHGRPVNGEHERRAVLSALADVDEVRIFDELTPCSALAALRPDVFVKGEDYLDVELPEREVLAGWGGTIEFAPLVPGRSTTRVLELASRLTG